MTKKLLKTADVLEWTGISREQWKKIKPLIPGVRLPGYKIMHWRRKDIAKTFNLEPTT